MPRDRLTPPESLITNEIESTIPDKRASYTGAELVSVKPRFFAALVRRRVRTAFRAVEEISRVKVAIALVKGKQTHDKRETIRRREVDRETRAAVKARNR